MDSSFLTGLIMHLPAIIIAFSVHEYAHARTAFALGDDTAARLGRLTLSPVAHIDPVGLILIIFFGFGWAKPVPVNAANFRRDITLRQGMMLTAAAGPLANLLLAVAACLALRFSLAFLLTHDWTSILADMIEYFIYLNILLMIFNLLPVPPLDGFRVLSGFLPPGAGRALDFLERYGWVLLVLLLATDLFGYVLSPLINLVSDLLIDNIVFG
jgi:Zn-dependent protease